jgi:uncharacterized membrane protein
MDWTKRKILAVYILFGVGAVLMTFPTPVGFFPLIIALLIGWVFRFGKDHDSLIYQHMIYISRTFWMWSALLTITTAVAGAAVITVADNSIYDRILDDMRNGIMYSNIMMVDALKTYIMDNLPIMIVAATFCIVPMIGYIGYRLYHGISHLMKDKPLPKPKGWF